MTKPLVLSADCLQKSFKSRKVVKSVSFNVKEKEVVGLLGPNGAGKTTSFYMVVGLLYPNDGAVYLGGENITQLPMHVRARKESVIYLKICQYLEDLASKITLKLLWKLLVYQNMSKKTF